MSARKRETGPRKRLDNATVAKLVALIDGIDPKTDPTWDAIVELGTSWLGHMWTRVGLQGKTPIKDARDRKLAEHRLLKAGGRVKSIRPETAAKQDRETRREARMSELEGQLRVYDEEFILIHANALRLGIPMHTLRSAIEPPDRGGTDPALKNAGKPRRST